jgi:CRP/FNR family transcriptional regulator
VRQLVLQKREVVYSAGLPAENVFVVRSGSVRITFGDACGGERITRFVHPGEVFGLDAFLPEKIRAFSAITREESVLCVATSSEFLRFVKQDCQRLWALFVQLDANAFNCHFEKLEMSGNRVSGRLRKMLARIRGTTPIEIKQWELAQFLGVSEETISREMKKMRAEEVANAPRKQSSSKAEIA